MQFKLIQVISCCLLLISCNHNSEETGESEYELSEEVMNPVDTSKEQHETGESEYELSEEVINSIYSSQEQYEIGLGESGEILGYWMLTFEEGTYRWNYSDVGEDGTFSIKNNEITATSGNGTEHSVSYDWNNKILYWDGIPYIKQE